MSLTLTIEQLHRLLKPTVLFTSSDDMLPVLNCVHITAEGGQATAEATDRFKLGVSRLSEVEVEGELGFLIHRNDVKALLSTFKATGRSRQSRLTLGVEGGVVTVRELDGRGTFACPTHDGDFPKVQAFLRPALQVKPTLTEVCLDPTHFKAVCLAAEALKEINVVFRTPNNDRKATLAAVGENFIALVMPRRQAEGDGNNRFAAWGAA